jgi:uncharacterized protein (PEP-CTERM system associated)
MGANAGRRARRGKGTRQAWGAAPLALAIGAVLFCQGAWAGEWQFTPRLTLGQIYTDNVALAPKGKEQWDLFSQITPGLSLHGKGGRVSADVDYQLENYVSVRTRDHDSTSNRLKANATAELARQWLYLDASGGITQQIISPQERIAVSNLYHSQNLTDVYTYSVSPYLRHNFGGYANALLRYKYAQVFYGKSGISNTQFQTVDGRLASGRQFGRLSWGLSYHREDQQRQTTSNVKFENAAANIGYQVLPSLSLLAQGGYENNQYQTTRTAVVNGTYWGVGLGWRPNRYFSARALKGNQFETAGVSIAPSPRTSLSATYRKRAVGLNPGHTWSGTFNLNTRRTSWQALYLEDTTTVQQLALQQGYLVFPVIDPTTNQQVVDATGTPVFVARAVTFLGLTNDVLVRKIAKGSFGFKTARTGIRLSVFDERRQYQFSGQKQRTKGVNESWSWRFATRTSSILTAGWQRTGYATASGNTDLWYVDETIHRRIAPRLTGDLSYRHISQSGLVVGGGYDANQISFTLTMYF